VYSAVFHIGVAISDLNVVIFDGRPAGQEPLKVNNFHWSTRQSPAGLTDKLGPNSITLSRSQAFDEFMRVCDQLTTFLGRKQVADRSELSLHVEITRTCLRPGSSVAVGFRPDRPTSGI